MTPPNKRENAAGDWQRAARCLRAAEVLAREGLHEDAASDAYYACFHAVRALLFTLGEEPRSHRGALHLLNVHFVLTGRIDARVFALISKAHSVRLEADYGTSPNVSAQDAEHEIDTARTVLGAVRPFLEQAGVKVA